MSSRLSTILLGMLCTLVLAAGCPPAAYAGEEETTVDFTRIGVVPLRDDSSIRDGGELLTEMLKSRLGARFKGVEFIIVDPGLVGLKSGTLLLEEAVKLGAHYDADALLDGVFGGIEIVGGTWPNRGSDHPQARGFLRWRLVECTEGLLVVDGVIKPKKPKVYSPRISSTEKLIRRVMQDLVAAVGDELEQAEVLPGTEGDAEQGEN